MNRDMIVQVRATSLFRTVGERQLMILDVTTRRISQLSDLAAFVFLKLDGGRTIGEVIDLTRTKFAVRDAQLEPVILKFVKELFDLNLLAARPERNLRVSEASSWMDQKDLAVNLNSLTVGSSSPVQ